MMKFLMSAFCILLIFGGENTWANSWQPSQGHTQLPIWPTGKMPDAIPVTKPEEMRIMNNPQVAGKSWINVGPVSQPTITVYPPKGKNTGAAVVVFPGGGYWILAIDLEGTEVCDWLSSKGITCVLLKYRVPGEGLNGEGLGPRSGPYPKSSIALEDAQRAIGLVRFNATKWHIDPHKIGVLGFSAGGHLVTATSTHFQKRIYQGVDVIDKISCKPDFAIALYPGHLWIDKSKFELNPNVPATKQTPPTFLLQAENDHVDNVNDSLVYYIALKNAGVPVEMHLYAEGGHAFGLRRTNFQITKWPQLVETWLNAIGMIAIYEV